MTTEPTSAPMNAPTVASIAGAGVALDCWVTGPEDGELVVLLHGFPEDRSCWRSYLPALATAGYRVVAPNQRGYGHSDKPSRVRDYGLDNLADDIVALIRSLGHTSAHVVGHDWGGVVTWWLAHARSDVTKTVTVMNVPHHWVLRRMILGGSWAQTRRSWYVLLFQLPWLAEHMLSRDGFSRARAVLEKTSAAGAFSRAELDSQVENWSIPGAMKAMIHWYRAALWHPPQRPAQDMVEVPLQLIWGDLDHALGTELIAPSMRMASNGKLHRFADATHWVHREKAAEILPLLLAHWRR